MRTIKTALTKLKHQIEQEFNNDYVFFETITLANILNEIETIYNQIDKFTEINNPIEIAFLKRRALTLINNLSKLTTKTEWRSNEETRFIGYLIAFKRLIKETYFIEVKGEFRTEEERQAISADITKIKANLAEHIALENQLAENKAEFEKLQTSLSALEKSYKAAKVQTDDIAEWYSAADEHCVDIATFAKTAESNLAKITTFASTAETNKPKIEKYHVEIEEMIKLFNKQKDDIQEIIEDANRASMAGSFKKQMEDINVKMRWADGFLIGALIITAAISLWGFNSSLITQTLSEGQIHTQFDWVQFFAKSAISLPFLIVAWIKSKERAYLFRLREDYGYKYSSAMAFEGYRKQVQEQSPELEEQLLQIAVDNLGSNPTKVFERDLKSTPLETIIDGVGKRLDKAVEGIKGQVKNIPQKTKELIDE